MKNNTPLSDASIGPMQASPVAPNMPVAAELPPPFPQLQSGEIPAILIPAITQELLQDPAMSLIIEIFGQLADLGLETYEAKDMSTVIYNPNNLDEPTLIEAESNGNLSQLALPIFGSSEPQAGPSTAPLSNMQVQTSAPSNVNKSRLTTARAQNISPKQISPVQPNPISSQLSRRAM